MKTKMIIHGVGIITRVDMGMGKPTWATHVAGALRNFDTLREAKKYCDSDDAKKHFNKIKG